MRILRFAKFVAESTGAQAAQAAHADAPAGSKTADKARKPRRAGRAKPVSVPGWTKY